MFQTLMAIGVLITVSSSSWLSLWFGMELTILFFLPFVSNLNWFGSLVTLWQFMFYSVFSSMIFLFSGSFLSITEIYDWSESTSTLAASGLMAVIALKLGLPPLHGWSIAMISGLSWKGVYLFSTMLKLAPAYILVNMLSVEMSVLPLYTLILSMFMSFSLRGLMTNSLRVLLAYSSVLSTGWIVVACLTSESLTLAYLIVYFSALLSLTSIFSSWGVSTLQDLSMTELSVMEKAMLIMSLMNLAGIPPSLGFFVKLSVSMKLMKLSLLLLLTLIALSTAFMSNYLQMMMFSLSNCKVSLWSSAQVMSKAVLLTTLSIMIFMVILL